MNTLQEMIAHGATHIDLNDLNCHPWMKRDTNGWHYWDDDGWYSCVNIDEHNLLPLLDDQPAPYWADKPDEPEWKPIDGLPPAGHPCQVIIHTDEKPQWRDAVVRYYGTKFNVIEIENIERCLPGNTDWDFRRQPTPDARRAQTINKAVQVWADGPTSGTSSAPLTDMLEELYDAHLLGGRWTTRSLEKAVDQFGLEKMSDLIGCSASEIIERLDSIICHLEKENH